MWKEADQDGRYPVSFPEYQAIRAMFGVQNALIKYVPALERRVKTIPGGWRDLRLLVTLMEKLMEKVLFTVPAKKLLAMRRELQYTVTETKVNPAITLADDRQLCAVPRAALDHLIDKAMQYECFGCERCDYKRCQLFQSIQATYHHDFPKSHTCPLADMTFIREDERHEN